MPVAAATDTSATLRFSLPCSSAVSVAMADMNLAYNSGEI